MCCSYCYRDVLFASFLKECICGVVNSSHVLQDQVDRVLLSDNADSRHADYQHEALSNYKATVRSVYPA